MLLRSAFLAVLLIAAADSARSQWQPRSDKSQNGALKYCKRLQDQGPEFALLALACESVGSPKVLPPYSCNLSMERSRSDIRQLVWEKLPAITAQVHFYSDRSEKYSDVAVDGKPVKGTDSPHDEATTSLYYGKSMGWSFVSQSLALDEYPGDLPYVFDRGSKTEFKVAPDVVADKEDYGSFVFQVHQNNPVLAEKRGITFSPASDLGGMIGRLPPAVRGSVWIDRKNHVVRRLALHIYSINERKPPFFEDRTVEYGVVDIPGFHDIVLPIRREVKECGASDCSRIFVTYGSCRLDSSNGRTPAQPKDAAKKK